MQYIFKNATVFDDGVFKKYPSFVIGKDFAHEACEIKADNLFIFPGFLDVHVHFREPGFFYKETIRTGSLAAARGGYTDVCAMPNLNPIPDSAENLNVELDIIKKDAVIGGSSLCLYHEGRKGRKSRRLASLKAAVAFSDDGRGVQDEQMMKDAMIHAATLNKIIAAHCEVNELLNGGYIHDGDYAKLHSHKGICSKSEWAQVERDKALAEQTGCAYHVCHISTKESVELIRNAKKRGVNVTCETAPHYLLLTDMDLREEGRFKMNPPIRSKEDRDALIEGLKDGTIDMIATDHAPHSIEEKSKGLKGSLMGIVGLETAFPLLYTNLVKKGIISLEKLIELMCINPRKRFNIPNSGYCVWDLNCKYKIDTDDFRSMGRSTPFEGEEVYGKCIMTIYGGDVVWKI